MDNEQKTIQRKILTVIESGKVKMRPKWHFVLKAILIVLGMILLYLTLLYLISFMIFVVREDRPWMGPGPLMVAILDGLPWFLIALALVFIGLLQHLVKKYQFGYGKPLFYLVLAIIGVVALGSLIVDASDFHRHLFERSHMHRLPFGGERFYLRFGPRHMIEPEPWDTPNSPSLDQWQELPASPSGEI